MLELIGCFGCVDDSKLKDPKMTIRENPMFYGRPDPIVEANRKRMAEDAKLRANPLNGRVYEAFKSLQYKPQEK